MRKWTGRYETGGVEALRLGYRGSESYLSVEQRREIEDWVGAHETVTVEEVRDYMEAHHGVVSQSKQSYYESLEAGGMSYHRSEKVNPKRDEAQVLNQTSCDWYTSPVTLSVAKGLAVRFFACGCSETKAQAATGWGRSVKPSRVAVRLS